MMKKSVVMLVVLMFISCMVVIAEDPVVEEDCGFFCSVGEFLFGSSDARALAGTAWLD